MVFENAERVDNPKPKPDKSKGANIARRTDGGGVADILRERPTDELRGVWKRQFLRGLAASDKYRR